MSTTVGWESITTAPTGVRVKLRNKLSSASYDTYGVKSDDGRWVMESGFVVPIGNRAILSWLPTHWQFDAALAKAESP